MSVAGLCGICELAQADRRCQRCGTFVCTEHFEGGQGVCVRCASGGDGDLFQV